MRTNLRELYKKINKSHPFVGSLIYRIYRRKPFNKINRMIQGRNNTISYKYATILTSVIFDIKGNGNRIEIGEKSILNNVKFHIRGHNHRVIIDRNATLREAGVYG